MPLAMSEDLQKALAHLSLPIAKAVTDCGVTKLSELLLDTERRPRVSKVIPNLLLRHSESLSCRRMHCWETFRGRVSSSRDA